MTDFTLTIQDDTLWVTPNTEAALQDLEPCTAIAGRYPFDLDLSDELCQDWRAKGFTYSYEGTICDHDWQTSMKHGSYEWLIDYCTKCGEERA